MESTFSRKKSKNFEQRLGVPEGLGTLRGRSKQVMVEVQTNFNLKRDDCILYFVKK